MTTTPTDGEIAERLPLSPPVYHVLLTLGDRALHGYGIMQEFEELTGGREQLLAGTLYATLSRMVEGGLLVEAEPPSDSLDARRKYYRATELGRSLAAHESERLDRLLDIARMRRFVPESS